MAAGIIASALAAGGGVASGANPERVLSHFLCYIGQFRPQFDSAPTVGLKDQFGSADAVVRQPNIFCNPVRKTRGGEVTEIVDRDHHLKHYPLQALVPTAQTQDLLITNQFGIDQRISLNLTPIALLVPTRKVPHDRPRGLDHYVCYNVHSSTSIDRTVRLRDQFGSYRTPVLQQWLHCNPVEKTHGSRPPTSIAHPRAHLACYLTARRGADEDRKRVTINQFEKASVEATFKPGATIHLCVPSKKKFV
jgi:hypothetical protein